METVSITENELLAALASERQQCPPDAMTAAELRQALGLKSTALRTRLQRLATEGRLETWYTTRIDMAGRPQSVPAYTIKPASKSKGRR